MMGRGTHCVPRPMLSRPGRPDRSSLDPAVLSDLLEQIYSRLRPRTVAAARSVVDTGTAIRPIAFRYLSVIY
jgi:hypothetical protein